MDPRTFSNMISSMLYERRCCSHRSGGGVFSMLAFLTNSLVPLVGIAYGAIHFALSVEAEEADLAAKFGNSWEEYAARVPRCCARSARRVQRKAM